MGTESPWRWGRGTISANLDVIWGMSDYSGSKEFLEAGKKRLAGDTGRQATSGEVKGLGQEMRDLKALVAELSLENRLLKKNMIGHGGGEE